MLVKNSGHYKVSWICSEESYYESCWGRVLSFNRLFAPCVPTGRSVLKC